MGIRHSHRVDRVNIQIERAVQEGNATLLIQMYNQDILNLPSNKQRPFLTNLLYIAIENDRINCVEYLLDWGADIDVTLHKDKNTPLHKACDSHSTNNLTCCKLLLQTKADINAQNIWKRTPLITAIINFKNKLAKYLIDEKADVNIADENGTTPLMVCASYGNQSLLQKLLSHKACINQRDKLGRTALHFAVVGMHIDIIKHLIDLECLVSTYDVYGQTPLHVAITKCNKEIVDILIKSGIVVEPTEAHIADLCVKIVQSTLTRCVVTHTKNDCVQALASLHCMRQVVVAMGQPLKKSIREKLVRIEKSIPPPENLPATVISVIQVLSHVIKLVENITAGSPLKIGSLQSLCRRKCREALMISGHNVIWAAKKLEIHSFLIDNIIFNI